ncbi:hypothetical protein GQ53DRAFT_823636 [Thozetella sp. PMI_491]|nr:hypothetical protein GQ53DRAFT_823636 [Thozetella sp. PMI_491]
MANLTSRTATILLFGTNFATFLGWRLWEGAPQPWISSIPDQKPYNDDFIPKQYFVHLYPGNTIKDVGIATGRDIESFINTVFDFKDGKGLVFAIHEAKDDLVAAIRSFQGVRLVERNSKGGHIEGGGL